MKVYEALANAFVKEGGPTDAGIPFVQVKEASVEPWIRAAGWWLILSTLNLHTIGASFARTRLLERGVSNWRRRALVLSALAILVLVAVLWVRFAVPAPEASDIASVDALKYYLRQALESGPALYVLYPFRLLARPYLAPDALAFLLAFVPAFALMAAHYMWVVRSEVAFEEASLSLAQKRAEILAAVRAGNWHGPDKTRKRRRAPFAIKEFPPFEFALLALRDAIDRFRGEPQLSDQVLIQDAHATARDGSNGKFFMARCAELPHHEPAPGPRQRRRVEDVPAARLAGGAR